MVAESINNRFTSGCDFNLALLLWLAFQFAVSGRNSLQKLMLSLDQNTAKLKNTTIKDHHNQVTEQKKAKKKKKNNRKAHKDDIWEAGDATERERIREFWINLGEEERKALVKLEKDSVLKKMKEQQKQNCSCSVCGRKRYR